MNEKFDWSLYYRAFILRPDRRGDYWDTLSWAWTSQRGPASSKEEKNCFIIKNFLKDFKRSYLFSNFFCEEWSKHVFPSPYLALSGPVYAARTNFISLNKYQLSGFQTGFKVKMDTSTCTNSEEWNFSYSYFFIRLITCDIFICMCTNQLSFFFIITATSIDYFPFHKNILRSFVPNSEFSQLPILFFFQRSIVDNQLTSFFFLLSQPWNFSTTNETSIVRKIIKNFLQQVSCLDLVIRYWFPFMRQVMKSPVCTRSRYYCFSEN